MTDIGDYAFYGCSKLISVTVMNPIPASINSSTFSNRANATLYVLKGCKTAYEAANYWKEFKKVVEIDPRTEQTLTLSEIPTLTVGDAPYELPATTNEGLALNWSVGNNRIAVISEGKLIVKARGETTVTATQAGNEEYQPFTREFTLTVIDLSYMTGDINNDGVVDVSDYTGIANHIHGNTPEGFNAKAADVDENGTIDVSDCTGIANIIHTGSIYGNSSNSARATGNQPTADWDAKDNVIFIAPFTATAGTKTAISIEMKNTAAIRGFQFDLYLPEGMTVVKSAKGKIQGKLSEGRLPDEDEHDLTFSQQADGAIRFLCSSQYDETFTGTSGELATLQVEIASDMANGDHAIQLKNMKLTETDISKYYTSDLIESTVTIEGGATTGINSLTSDPSAKGEESGNIYSLDGRKVSNSGLPKGIYIKNGRKVVIK